MKRTAVVFALVLLTAMVFAAGMNEETEDFQTLDMKTASVEKIVSTYEKAQERYTAQVKGLKDEAQKAYVAKDVTEYLHAKELLESLVAPEVTKEQTEALMERMESAAEAEVKEIAEFLSSSSRYYRPVLTLTYSYSNGSSSRSYTQKLVKTPGATVVLPSLSGEGQFLGWGTEEGKVEYKAGDEIQMPYTNKTLYASFAHGITLVDSLNGTSEFVEGTEASLPASVSAPEGCTAIFMGWYDASGNKIEGDKTSVEAGSDAVVQAAWKNAELSITGIRNSRKGAELVFALKNTGNIALKDVTFTLEAVEGITATPETLSASRIGAGKKVSGSFALSGTMEKGQKVDLKVVAKDADGAEIYAVINVEVV